MSSQETGMESVGRSANERFKERWDQRVAWSTVAAVAFHAALFGWAGFAIVRPLIPDPSPSQGQLVVVPGSFLDGIGLEGATAPVALPEEESSETQAADSGGLDGIEEGGAGDGDLRDLWAAASARLGRNGQLRAEVTEVDQERSADEDADGDTDELSVAALDSTQILAELAHADSLDLELDLDRLAEIRPELAVMIPSMWILLRNPTEVETFLRRSYRRWPLDASEPGSVTVTVWIDTRGSVEWAEVSRSSGRSDLDEAALALFNEVVAFRPARHEGVSISGSATFALLFPW